MCDRVPATASPTHLAELTAGLAEDLRAVQRRLDLEHRDSCEDIRAALAASPLTAALLASSIPPRLQLGPCRIALRVALQREHLAGGGIRVTPLNLGYEAMFGSAESVATRLELTFAPLATNLETTQTP